MLFDTMEMIKCYTAAGHIYAHTDTYSSPLPHTFAVVNSNIGVSLTYTEKAEEGGITLHLFELGCVSSALGHQLPASWALGLRLGLTSSATKYSGLWTWTE